MIPPIISRVPYRSRPGVGPMSVGSNCNCTRSSSSDVEAAREVYERAVVSVGSHFVTAGQLWASYCSFEARQLGVATAEGPEADTAQRARVGKVDARWLSAPIDGTQTLLHRSPHRSALPTRRPGRPSVQHSTCKCSTPVIG